MMVMKLLRFFKRVNIPIPIRWREKKDVAIMPTKIMFTEGEGRDR